MTTATPTSTVDLARTGFGLGVPAAVGLLTLSAGIGLLLVRRRITNLP